MGDVLDPVLQLQFYSSSSSRSLSVLKVPNNYQVYMYMQTNSHKKAMCLNIIVLKVST